MTQSFDLHHELHHCCIPPLTMPTSNTCTVHNHVEWHYKNCGVYTERGIRKDIGKIKCAE